MRMLFFTALTAMFAASSMATDLKGIENAAATGGSKTFLMLARSPNAIVTTPQMLNTYLNEVNKPGSTSKHLIIDLQMPDDFEKAHIKGAVNWPTENSDAAMMARMQAVKKGEIPQWLLDQLDGVDTVVINCRAGSLRSPGIGAGFATYFKGKNVKIAFVDGGVANVEKFDNSPENTGPKLGEYGGVAKEDALEQYNSDGALKQYDLDEALMGTSSTSSTSEGSAKPVTQTTSSEKAPVQGGSGSGAAQGPVEKVTGPVTSNIEKAPAKAPGEVHQTTTQSTASEKPSTFEEPDAFIKKRSGMVAVRFRA